MTVWYVRGSYRSSAYGESVYAEHIDDLEDLGGVVEEWPDWRALDHITVEPIDTTPTILDQEEVLEYGSDDDARWVIELFYKPDFSQIFGLEELNSFSEIYDPNQPFYRMTIRYAYSTYLTIEDIDP